MLAALCLLIMFLTGLLSVCYGDGYAAVFFCFVLSVILLFIAAGIGGHLLAIASVDSYSVFDLLYIDKP